VLDNNLTLILWVPVSGITESIQVSNRFTFIIAFITMLISIMSSFFFSKQFTKPITKMNIIAKNMLNLDFGKTLDSHSEDELGHI
jgi:signal transduction histidine kinase